MDSATREPGRSTETVKLGADDVDDTGLIGAGPANEPSAGHPGLVGNIG